MGYNTDYTLEVCSLSGAKLPETTNTLVPVLQGQCVEADYSLDPDGSSSGNESRWYEHEADMRSFSETHRDLVFVLSGDGEESGDIWKKYFFNGQMQVEKAKLQIGEFDRNKLI